MSIPYSARPVALSLASWAIGRVPMTLNWTSGLSMAGACLPVSLISFPSPPPVFDSSSVPRRPSPPARSCHLRGRHFLPLCLHSQHQAGVHHAAVEQDGAGPAIAVVAALLGSR